MFDWTLWLSSDHCSVGLVHTPPCDSRQQGRFSCSLHAFYFGNFTNSSEINLDIYTILYTVAELYLICGIFYWSDLDSTLAGRIRDVGSPSRPRGWSFVASAAAIAACL